MGVKVLLVGLSWSITQPQLSKPKNHVLSDLTQVEKMEPYVELGGDDTLY